MRIAIVLATYPQESETFVQREIAALREAGLSIVVWALRRGRVEATATVEMGAPVVYRPGRLSAQALGSIAWLVIRRPGDMLRLVGCILATAVHSPGWALRLALNTHTVARFARAAARDGIDHVHGYFLNLPAVVAMAVGTTRNLPLTLAGHARDLFVDPGPLDLLLRRARQVRVCSSEAARYLEHSVPEAGRPKVRLIHHGIDVHTWCPPASRREPTVPLLMAIGRFVPKKGFDVLLCATGILRRRGAAAHLALVGDGPLQQTLRRLTADEGLDGDVTFTGWLSQESVRRLLRQATVLAVPSLPACDGDRDGLPNVVLEAAACGALIVASRVPGLCEFIEDGCNGLLCEPGDAVLLAGALERALADGPLRERLGCQARRTVEGRFGMRRCVEQMEAFFAGD